MGYLKTELILDWFSSSSDMRVWGRGGGGGAKGHTDPPRINYLQKVHS